MTPSPGSTVGPHDFASLRWWDNRPVGRCKRCHMPRMGHPVTRTTYARPLGDISEPDYQKAGIL